ncbi:hypothetical protein MT418_001212 [Batrachochytrium dendrobatidis]
MDRKASILLLVAFIILVVLFTTRPDESSFHRQISLQVKQSSGMLWGILSLNGLVKAATAKLMRYDSYGIFATMSLAHGRYGRSPLRSLGLFYTWFDVSGLTVLDHLPRPDALVHWVDQIRSNCPACRRGICMPMSISPPTSSCVCIPGYIGVRCDRPLPNTVTIWDAYFETPLAVAAALHPQLLVPISDWSRSPTVFGIPLLYLSRIHASLPSYMRAWGLVNISQYIGILEVLVGTMIIVHLLWQFVRLTGSLRLEMSLVETFTTSYNQIVHKYQIATVFMSQLSHVSLVHLAFNVYGFANYAPLVYQEIGHSRFVVFVGATMVLVVGTSVGLAWAMSGHRVGWKLERVSGASGWIMALRLFSLLEKIIVFKHGTKLQWWNKNNVGVMQQLMRMDWGEVWAIVGPQLVMDVIVGGNLGADVGGIVAAVAYCWYSLAFA